MHKHPSTKLSPDQVEKGMLACLKNACDKCESADILFNSGKYDSAISLYVIAIQELGKMKVILSIGKRSKDINYNLSIKWKDFYTHSYKDIQAIVSVLGVLGDSTREIVSKYLSYLESEGLTFPESNRIASLYVDFNHKSQQWKIPGNDFDMAQKMKIFAGTYISSALKEREKGFLSKEYLEKYFDELYLELEYIIYNYQSKGEDILTNKDFYKEIEISKNKFLESCQKEGILKKV